MLGTFFPISFICGIFSFFFFLFTIKDNLKKYNAIVYFSLGIYIPLMVLLFFLLSKFIEIRYIFGLLTLLLLNYASVELVYMIFKIKKNYSYAAFASIINLIYLIIFFVIIKETSIKAIILMSTTAYLIIVYIQLYNYALLFNDKLVSNVSFFAGRVSAQIDIVYKDNYGNNASTCHLNITIEFNADKTILSVNTINSNNSISYFERDRITNGAVLKIVEKGAQNE